MEPVRRPRWIDIADAWRSRLGRAPWLPGARLPPNTEIGREFGVSKSRAQQALASLAAEGFLVRVPGRGTFVAAKAAPLAAPRRVGILLDDDARRLPYYPHMASLLCDALAARGIDAWMRPIDTAKPNVGAVLAKAVRETGVSALFLCPVNSHRYDAIRALRPPVPLLCNHPLRYVAYAPDIVIYDRIAAALKRIGARRPAFATHIHPKVADAAYGPEGTIDIPRKDADGAWGAMFRRLEVRDGATLTLTGGDSSTPALATIESNYASDMVFLVTGEGSKISVSKENVPVWIGGASDKSPILRHRIQVEDGGMLF